MSLGLTVTWTAMERDRELSEEHESQKQTSATFRVEKKKTGTKGHSGVIPTM